MIKIFYLFTGWEYDINYNYSEILEYRSETIQIQPN
jgi:hypothetical protein